MEQKLRSALPARTAWIVLGLCALFWLLSALGLLQLSASVPPLFMFFWLYLNALAALFSVLASGAAVAALLLHRRAARAAEPIESGVPRTGSVLDDAEETGLDQLLDGPAASLAAEPAAASGRAVLPQPRRQQGNKRRKR
ncbi:MAG: hypothetical protein ABS910_01115 [Arthrobacter sp.]